MPPPLLRTSGGTLVLPSTPLVDRDDGGHLIVEPPRPVWERSELTASELTRFSALVAASGYAMLTTLPALRDGCVNYWEAGNWSLHAEADPIGPKDPRHHRRVHLHLFGRSPRAQDPSWVWGEAPAFPRFAGRVRWSAGFRPLTAADCARIAAATVARLRAHYDWPPECCAHDR